MHSPISGDPGGYSAVPSTTAVMNGVGTTTVGPAPRPVRSPGSA
jgi:hypothetical protein